MTTSTTPALILSCEHATHHVPDQYRPLLAESLDTLDTHKGYDPGAYDFASLLAARLSVPLFAGKVSRLLVDLNRSLTNHRSPPISSRNDFPVVLKEELLAHYYHPYRRQVEEAITRCLRQEKTVLHLSIHSFTPVLDGARRTADVGYLYDPSRAREKEICGEWLFRLKSKEGQWRLRRNYPYRGVSDGFVPALRKIFSKQRYVGIELEINQMYPLGMKEDWLRLQHQLLESFVEVLAGQDR
ncbi:MAG: N-formylglutamate amidohydrolase [Proteobacteria bacterium]|nr:N-formylglutamate amidohydrolase [Pseudomonadota bacterium]MBU1639356.1 N-formylglutamate amidohydrolase [Pseudomonadota bacterium]